jgi:hypothetical protein
VPDVGQRILASVVPEEEIVLEELTKLIRYVIPSSIPDVKLEIRFIDRIRKRECLVLMFLSTRCE